MIELNHFINGNYFKSETQVEKIFNPATGGNIATMPIASTKEVQDAIKSANDSFELWSKVPSKVRADYLRKIANGFKKRKEKIAKSISESMGKPLNEAFIDVEDAIACYLYYSNIAMNIDEDNQETVDIQDTDFIAIKRREPVGPVGLIVPWNFPTVTTSWKVAPALAAGCTVVLKPSEVSPNPEYILAEIAKDILLPEGVINIVFGKEEVGKLLVESNELSKVSFTGSTKVGQHILSASATSLKNLSLELGGKSSLIICKDADIEESTLLACNGIFFNNGQMCSATSRLLVHKSIYGKVLESLKKRVIKLKIGNPLYSDTDLGPLSSKMQFDKISGFFKEAEKEKLACLVGGTIRDGNYVNPTVYYDVEKTSNLWNEEIFGPILCVAPFDNEEEAIALANDSEYGLAASVVSKDKDNALYIANQLKAGIIWVNTDQIVLPQLSWGGYKKSSIGRELGESGLHSYTELKHIILNK